LSNFFFAFIGRQQSVREAEVGRSETTKSAGTRIFVVRRIIFMGGDWLARQPAATQTVDRQSLP
jgi:hypothetical protein